MSPCYKEKGKKKKALICCFEGYEALVTVNEGSVEPLQPRRLQ